MGENERVLTQEMSESYAGWLEERERSRNTVGKYRRDVEALRKWLCGRPLTKAEMLGWKAHLSETYAASSANSMLAAANGFLRFMGWQEMSVRPLRVQRSLFCSAERELGKGEYVRLVEAARRAGKERTALVLQAICATGIRVSELPCVTAEAVRAGRAEVSSKGKRRVVFLPGGLRRLLGEYLRREGRAAGPVFVTRGGRPLDRSNIWREMKGLCAAAGVSPGKVFPHNLRHLFARAYYAIEKDLSRLADVLGHSSIDTTRIYTMESGRAHARQMERTGLVVT